MQAFHDFAFPQVQRLAGDLEDAFSDAAEYDGLERNLAENHFSTIRDAVSGYSEYVSSFDGSKEKLGAKHGQKIHGHLRRIHNAVERVTARLRLSPDSKERLTQVLDGHKRAVSAHLKKRLGK